jgi:hypothetical protein
VTGKGGMNEQNFDVIDGLSMIATVIEQVPHVSRSSQGKNAKGRLLEFERNPVIKESETSMSMFPGHPKSCQHSLGGNDA